MLKVLPESATWKVLRDFPTAEYSLNECAFVPEMGVFVVLGPF
jgi:hypothetical protein